MKKRIGACIAASAMLVTMLGGLGASAAEQWHYGDVDRNNDVDSSDARLVLQSSVGKVELDDVQLLLADVDANDTIDSSDARAILQYAVGKLTQFEAGEYWTNKIPQNPAITTPNPDPDTWADYTAGNPIITHMFTADPSAHVWADGRLYIYASHDVFPARGCDLMDKYHVFSTDNMVDWVDHGEVFSSADTKSWSTCEGFMWAPDAAEVKQEDGSYKYYFFYPHPASNEGAVQPDRDGKTWNETWRIAVAVSDSPTGPFTDLGPIKDVDGNPIGGWSMIDPCVFQDDDGSYYLYFGGGGNNNAADHAKGYGACFGAKLSADMTTLETPLQQMKGLTDFHEGVWMFKYDDLYYSMFADNNTEGGGNQQRYATSESPLGPWVTHDVILTPTGCDTSHGSIAQYRGNWYIFYHNQDISGVGNLRSVCVDKVEFDEFGAIQVVKQTRTSVPSVGPSHRGEEGSQPIVPPASAFTEKTDYSVMGAIVSGASLSTGSSTPAIINMNKANAYAEWTGVDGGKGGKALLTVTYSSNDNATSKVTSTADTTGDGYFLKVPKTSGWSDYSGKSTCIIDLKPGTDNTVRITGGMGGFNISGISISLLPQE